MTNKRKFNFGYGEENAEIKKVLLNDLQECKDYVDNALSELINAKYKNGKLYFDNEIIKVSVTKVKN